MYFFLQVVFPTHVDPRVCTLSFQDDRITNQRWISMNPFSARLQGLPEVALVIAFASLEDCSAARVRGHRCNSGTHMLVHL